MIYLILLLGLILRLIAINQSLWLDEAIGALVVRDMSFHDIFSSFLPVDNHPPLYYLMLKLWTELFGYSEITLRLPSVIFGVATIYLTYLICIKITNNKKIGLMTSLMLSTSQFHIYYSQEARMYSMAALFAAVTIYSYMQIVENNKFVKYWLIFSASITLMVYTDYMPVFLLPVFFLYGLFKKKEKIWWIKFILSFLPIFILGILWFPVLNRQIAGGKWLLETVPTWKSVAGGASIKQLLLIWIKFSLGRISIQNKLQYYLIIILTSIPFTILFVNSFRYLKKYSPVFLWLFLTLGLSYLASFLFPIFIYFRLLYIIPAFYLILGIVLADKNKKFAYTLFASVIFINIISWIYYINNPLQQREQWNKAVYYVEDKMKNDEVVLFSYPEPFAPYRWYENKSDISFGATDSIYADKINTIEKTNKLLAGVKGIYYFEYLKDISDPNSTVLSTIKNNGFLEVVKIGRFNGVGYIYYFRR